MRDAYAQSRIFIAPMRIGTGLQNKLLEAMSMRLPCITTALANNPLGAEIDKEILVGNNEQELANHIITLLNDKEKADSIAQNGYDFVHRVYDWGKATRIMELEMRNVELGVRN
jgi:glycosyltransferase involved in cell wall biosynthesis